MTNQFSTCVTIPVYNRPDQVQKLCSSLEKQLDSDTVLLLVDDGSADEASRIFREEISGKNNLIHYVRHQQNQGIAAARNTALAWCRSRNIDLVIMVDSDCEIPDDFVAKHIELHRAYPEVACFGGGVQGIGKGYWAEIDKIMSWAHVVPTGPVREFVKPYCPPTANISFKMKYLPDEKQVFNELLPTGEDVLLNHKLRSAGRKIYFSPEPTVIHHDRDKMNKVVSHVFSWGEHMYFIQLGGYFSDRCFKLWYRIIFFLSFLCAAPAFATLGTFLVLKQWARSNPLYLFHFPVIFILWLLKAAAVLKAAANPWACLRQPGGESAVDGKTPVTVRQTGELDEVKN